MNATNTKSVKSGKAYRVKFSSSDNSQSHVIQFNTLLEAHEESENTAMTITEIEIVDTYKLIFD